jgi:aryl-phospho-beta-D-glucosidase BglC (GH1 family)
VNGTKVVDPSGKTVILRGTNLGGWLVFEDWMCGITDQSGNNDREPQVTLESRFNLAPTKALIDTWQNNWITSADFDNMKSLGFNLVRVPFSYRNFKWSNGSYINETDAFSRLDWAVAQAKSRGMYLVLDFHVWEGQIGQGSSNYSIISWVTRSHTRCSTSAVHPRCSARAEVVGDF